MPENPPELVNVPVDLTLVSDDELQALTTAANAEFAGLNEGETTATTVERAMKLSDDILRLRSENNVRAQRAADTKAREDAKLAQQMASLRAEVNGPETPETGTTPAEIPVAPVVDHAAIAAAAAQGFAAVLQNWNPNKPVGNDLAGRINTSLSDAQRHAPEPQVPAKQLVVTASVDIPGVATGSQLDFDDVVDAFQKRAKALPIGNSGNPDAGPRVVTIRNEFEHTLDEQSKPSTVQDLFRYLTSNDKQEALVAGGGWCAPSEIRYNFFNIACEDGLIDLPTFGVSRGGIQFPVSPSLADVQLAPFVSGFSNASNPWLWTETDDQATVTGTPNKPCIRVPCPTFTERRLECYGICLTAGNLTNDAYPEATQNFLRLLMASHSHAMNARIIATMVGLSTAATSVGTTAESAYNNILGSISLAAADYRARYGMCRDDILEVVLPYWVLEALQSDLAWRPYEQGMLSVSKAAIQSYFADRGVRVQFVNDWQVRGAGQFGNASAMTVWPATVTLMMYAAGTFVKGNGLSLDLGVVRDSTLNAENDYTAAWSEECHLVAKVGHESRQYTIAFNVGGGNFGPAGTAPSM